LEGFSDTDLCGDEMRALIAGVREQHLREQETG
jgi:hypothetical protein